ncbi:MAG: exopolysaccharide biosynthesis protein [Pseudomonadota bacterium]|nr:exopolysaccharide biosynthesis protein [Pseudomonadota bacterium]MEE3101649.1 exopolysaccharide biosynthesis protein [Pseudomonadota bacterium]
MRDGSATGAERRDGEDDERSLVEVLDRIGEAGSDGEVTVNEVLDGFSGRSLGVMLTALGLIAAMPIIGDIPGMSMLTGALILAALIRQWATGRGIRAPGRVGRRGVEAERMEKALDRARPWAARVDRLLKPRLTVLTSGPAARAALAVAAGAMALTFFPLAFVPFGVKAPALAVLAFGLARMTRDGYAAAAGYALAVVTLGVLWGGFGLIADALG